MILLASLLFKVTILTIAVCGIRLVGNIFYRKWYQRTRSWVVHGKHRNFNNTTVFIIELLVVVWLIIFFVIIVYCGYLAW